MPSPKRQRRPLYGYLFFDKKLPKKEEVLRIAQATGMHRREVAMALLEFWSWLDDNSPDGKLSRHNVGTLSLLIEDTTEVFWAAVRDVGWLIETADGIEIPNFERWMGSTAKKRWHDAEHAWNKRHSLTANCDTEPTTGPTANRQECDKKPTSAHKAKAKAKSNKEPPNIPPELDHPQFREAWEKWKQHRAEKRKPLTPTSTAQQFAELAKLGLERAVAAIEHSIAQGYQGIFEPKDHHHEHKPADRLGRVDSPPGKYAGIGTVCSNEPDSPAASAHGSEGPLFACQGTQGSGDPPGLAGSDPPPDSR